MDAWREAVVTEAKRWLGTPWHHHARVRGVGVDCAQLLIGVFSAAGLIEPFETGDYPQDWMLNTARELFIPFVEQYMDLTVTPDSGDIVLWKFGRGFSHGGIVMQVPKIIHAYRKDRAVVWGDITDTQLARRPSYYYTFRGVPA